MSAPAPNTLTRWGVERFGFDPLQPRKTFDEVALRALGLSMTEVGQLQPVGAKPDGTLLWGERRVRAARLVGLAELAVIVADRVMTDAEIRTIQLNENYHRESLTGWELYLAAKGMKEGDPTLTNRDLAKRLSVDESTVSLWLAPDRGVEAVKDALERQVITLSDAVKIARLPADRQPGVLALVLSKASPAAVAAAGRKAPSQPTAKLTRVKLPLPGGVLLTAAGRSMDLDALLGALTTAVELVKRCKRDGLQIDTVSRVLADKSQSKETAR